MLKAIDVANFFIDASKSFEEDFVTNLRVNKLIYFAQAWSLVKYDRPLFDEKIEAWTYGPVIREVYDAFKICGSNPIADTLDGYDVSNFTSEELDLLSDVAIYYGQFSTPKLVSISHKKGSPWDKAVKTHDKFLAIDDIKAYYKGILLTQQVNAVEDEYIGYHDENGHLVLPQEWDDANAD